MLKKTIPFKHSLVNYYCFGSGAKQAVCFHGYAEDASSFFFFEKIAGKDFTFYAIDLPYHGSTKWNDDLNISANDLKTIIEKILQEEKNNNTQLTLLGFSLGGRIALSLYEVMPEKVEKLLLLAPDGLKLNFWYWLSTQTFLGNRLFKFTMDQPYWFFGLIKLLNKARLINASIYKFVYHYIHDKKIRDDLFNRWTCLKSLRPRLENIKTLINKHQTMVRLIYGKHDRIILSSVGENFCRGIEKNCSLTIIHSGHQVLHAKHAEEIIPALID